MQILSKSVFAVSDITMCLCVRLHEGNPWLLDNLKLQLEHYTPCPAIILVDQGSDPALADAAKALIAGVGGRYIRDDYAGLYSPSKAHNLAAFNVETDFIFFTDPDFFAVSDLFQRFISLLNKTDLLAQMDMMLNLPAYHLSQESTLAFKSAKDSGTRSAVLERAKVATILGDPHSADFVVPYSNAYLCRTDAFNLTGGYDENFAGHGSEDFEFLLRYALIMGRYPIPARPASEMHRPTQESFFHQHRYEGFRDLLGVLSFLAESSGLATFHLKHPIDGSSAWRVRGDRTRILFQNRVEPYLEDKRVLLDRDWLPRTKQLLVLVGDESQTILWLAFRLAGWRLKVVTETTALSVEIVNEEWEGVDAVAAFQSDIIRSPVFKAICQEAIQRKLEIVDIETGIPSIGCSCPTPCAPPNVDKISAQAFSGIFRGKYTFDGTSLLLCGNLKNKGRASPLCVANCHGAYAHPTSRSQIGPRAYVVARLGLLPKKQWEVFSKTGRVSSREAFFSRYPTLRKVYLNVKKMLLGCLPRV